MKILLYSISYAPELAGSGRFNGELTTWLAEKGYYVDVITAHPYYPEWKIKSSYKGKGWFVEKSNRLSVYRTPLYVPKRVTGFKRILHESSFIINSLVHWSKLLFKEYDVVISVCPPFHVALLPYIYSKIWRKPHIFHIQDLQVDAAKSLNMIKNQTLLTILDKAESFLLRNATWVSSISEGMKQRILLKGVKEEKYYMLENWVDTSMFKPIPVEASLKSELNFNVDDKIVLYSGNIGEKQGLEVLISAAELLRGDKSIQIVICGEGASKEKLIQEATKRKLLNVHFFPICPYDMLPRILAIADIHLVLQKRAAADLVMPSKLTNILSMGGAAIVSAEKNTWLNQLIVTNNLGWAIEPEDATILANTIKLAITSSQLQDYKANARRYASQFLEKASIMKKFDGFLKKL